MPLITLIQSWKTFALVSATLYLPCLALTIYLSVQQNAALLAVMAVLAWFSYTVHIMLVSSPAISHLHRDDDETRVLF